MREIEIRELDTEQRIVTGLAIPWGEVIDLGFTKEAFARGSVFADKSNPLFYQHQSPIGRILDAEDTEDGLLVRAKISRTTQGDDVIQLIKDGVVTGMSIGFSPQENHIQDGITTRVKAKIHEVSLVGIPAYPSATITDFRSADTLTQTSTVNVDNPQLEETKMEENMETNNEDFLKDEISNLKEDVLTLQRNAVVTTSEPVMQYRSYGEYIKGYAAQEDAAKSLLHDVQERAWTGGTSADSVFRDGWVGEKINIINKPRKVLNAFNRGTLPEEGLNVEYAKLNTDTTQVGVQAAEGDTLLYGKVAITTATAPVKTYGGYTSFTRQEVERASTNILDHTFTALAAKYASATNSAVRAAVVGASLPTVAVGSLAALTAKKLIGSVVDAATALDVNDYALDQIIVSGDVFKAIATLTDGSDRPLLYANNPVNNIGSVGGLSATLEGVPVIVDPGAAALTMWFASKQALTTYESGGAPFKLTDSDITNLTGSFSIYGYMAVALNDTAAIQKGTVTA